MSLVPRFESFGSRLFDLAVFKIRVTIAPVADDFFLPSRLLRGESMYVAVLAVVSLATLRVSLPVRRLEAVEGRDRNVREDMSRFVGGAG